MRTVTNPVPPFLLGAQVRCSGATPRHSPPHRWCAVEGGGRDSLQRGPRFSATGAAVSLVKVQSTVILFRLVLFFVLKYTARYVDAEAQRMKSPSLQISSCILPLLESTITNKTVYTAGLPVIWSWDLRHSFCCRGPISNPIPVLDSSAQTKLDKVLDFLGKT